MPIRDEIDAAAVKLGLDKSVIAAVPASVAEALISRFLTAFTGGVEGRWWWEHFRLPSRSAVLKGGQAFRRLVDIVPYPEAHVWFVAEDDELPSYPVYDATTQAVQQIIGECYAFEYYLIAKDLSWLICENHHNVVITIGATVQDRIPEGDATLVLMDARVDAP